MVSPATILTAGFLLVVIAFAAWITWFSLRKDAHSPAALQEEGPGTG